VALLDDYVTLTQLKSFLRITDTADDTELGFAITAASRAVDQATNRHFGQDAAVTARYYTVGQPDKLNGFDGRWNVETADISTVTGLLVKSDTDDDGTFETSLTIDTDFRLWPWNAAAESRPWERIVLMAGGSFPVQLRTVEVTAKFGWASVPTAIKQATLMQASRFFSRRNAPFGIAGSPEMGSELRLLAKVDPDVMVIVAPYKRLWAWA
jgi:hypothetical protein